MIENAPKITNNEQFATNLTTFITSKSSCIFDEIKNNIPFSKILILCLVSTFCKRGKKIKEQLEERGNNAIVFAYEDDYSFNLESAVGLFNLPENIRGVIVTDNSLVALSKYFCSIKQIPCYYYCNQMDLAKITSPLIHIKSKKGIDKFFIDCKRVLVIDEDKNSSKIFFESVIDYLLNRAVSLMDYKFINIVLGLKENENLTNNLKRLLDFMIYIDYKVIKRSDTLQKILNFENAIQNEKSITLSFSSIDACLMLYGNENKLGLERVIAPLILKIYNKCLEINAPKGIVDYRKRAETVSKLFRIEQTPLLKNFYNQASLFSSEKTIITRLSKEKSFLEQMNNDIQKLIKKTTMPKDIDSNKLCQAISSCGDTPFSLNGMSVFRQLGMLKE